MDIVIGNLKSKIITDNPKVIKALDKLYSFRVPGAEFSPSYKRKRWDGKKHYLSPTGAFATGLLPRILKDLKKAGCDPDLKNIQTFDSYKLENIDNLKYYSFQKSLIQKVLCERRGVIKSPTGSGKTLIMAGIIKSLAKKHKKMVILFNAKQLLSQTYEFLSKTCNMEDLGVCFGEGFIPGNIMLCTVQSIEKILDTHLDETEVLIIDEVHEFCKGKTTLAAIESFPNAIFRVGLTATPPTDKIPRYNLEGAIGPIWEEATTISLIESGKLARPIIQLLPTEQFNGDDYDLSYEEIYEKYIINNEHRNSLIKSVVDKIKQVNDRARILILTLSLEHASLLHEEIEGSLKLQGEDEMVKRYETISSFLSNDGNSVLIGTKILQTGVNIQEITHFINARGLRSEIATIQALGRAIRKHESKQQVYIYDFMDKAKYLDNHAKARKKYYLKEKHTVEEV